MTRLTIVGGGSAYMPGLAFSVARSAPALGDLALVLYDIDADALDVQTRLTQGILRANGAPQVAVESTLGLDRAVAGADFVLTTFRPGGFAARHLDEAIPPKYGVVGQETVGPGGLAMAFRSIPAVLAIAAAMRAEAADGAVLLNYTNPVQLVTDALVRHGGVPVLGLCDQHQGEIGFLAGLLGVDAHAVETTSFGTNHLTWTHSFRVAGDDRTGELFALLRSLDPADVDDDYWRPVVRMFPIWQLVPSRYLMYYVLHDEVLEAERASGRTRAQEIMAQLPPIVESYRREAGSADPRPRRGRYSEEHGDFAISVMTAMVTGEERRFILNVQNRGAIDGLADDAIVEVPCLLRGRDLVREQVGPMPEPVAGLTRQLTAHARMGADAAVAGDRELALRALMAHPIVHSLGAAEAMLDELLAAHAEQLPQFRQAQLARTRLR